MLVCIYGFEELCLRIKDYMANECLMGLQPLQREDRLRSNLTLSSYPSFSGKYMNSGNVQVKCTQIYVYFIESM